MLETFHSFSMAFLLPSLASWIHFVFALDRGENTGNKWNWGMNKILVNGNSVERNLCETYPYMVKIFRACINLHRPKLSHPVAYPIFLRKCMHFISFYFSRFCFFLALRNHEVLFRKYKFYCLITSIFALNGM